jgi:hypothetical protein
MANRNFTSARLYSMHGMVVSIDMRIAIGAAGAPTLTPSSTVTSVTRTAAGTYTVQLADNYNGLISAANMMESPIAGGVSGISTIEIVSGTAASLAPANLKGGSIIVQTLNSAGTPTDAASGSVLKLDLKLLNSTK